MTLCFEYEAGQILSRAGILSDDIHADIARVVREAHYSPAPTVIVADAYALAVRDTDTLGYVAQSRTILAIRRTRDLALEHYGSCSLAVARDTVYQIQRDLGLRDDAGLV